MMKHPFDVLKPEYTQLLSRMQVRPEKASLVDRVAKRLLGNLEHYLPVTAAIGVPVVFIATSFEREAASNFKLNPAQGWPLTSKSKIIPNNGPFPDWHTAALEAYRLNGLDKVGAAKWTWELICFYGEMFNGFGYRDYHAMRTPYLWGGTNLQTPGKYTSDGKFDSAHLDEQLGMIPVAQQMARLMPELAIGAPPTRPAPGPVEPVATAPLQSGLGNVRFLQTALNGMGYGPLIVDGSYGRQTMMAVQKFQQDRGITVDGLAGPQTLAAIPGGFKAGGAS